MLQHSKKATDYAHPTLMAKELVSPKDFLENIYDTTPDGIMVSDNKGYIIRVNRALEKMLGFFREEIIGKHTGEMSPNDEKHIEIGLKMLTELRAEGCIKNFEAYWSRKDGSLCPIELNITLFKDSEGNTAGSVAVIRDISERKKSEAALRESDERFHSLIQQANDAIFFVDGSGTIRFWNKRAEQLYGYTADEVLGKTHSIIVPQRFREAHKQWMKKFSSEDGSDVSEKVVQGIGERKDGSEFYAETSTAILKQGDEKLLVAIVRDITERKETEKELIKTRDFLEDIYNTTSDGIMISNAGGYIIKINRAVEKMLGFTNEEITGKHTAELSPQDEHHMDVGIKLMTDLRTEGFIKNFETTWIKKDGELLPVELNITLLKDKDKNRVGAVSVVRDIAGRKQTEEELKSTKDFLNNIIESSLDCIVVTDSSGGLIRVNKYFLNLLGYKQEEVIGKMVLEFAPQESGTYECTTGKMVEIDEQFFNDSQNMISELIERKNISNWQSYLIRKDRKIIPVEQNIVFLKATDEKQSGVVGIIRDITERKAAEERLKKAKEDLEKFIENSLDPIFIADSTGHVLTPNRAFLEMLGYQEQEVVGKVVDSLFIIEAGIYESTAGELVTIAEEFFTKNSSWMAQLYKNGKIFNWETYYLHKSRKVVPTTQNIILVYDSHGKISSLFCIIRDLTAQKKAEAELRISEARFRAIAESSIDAMVTSDSANMITFCNPAAEKMFGYCGEELIGQPGEILLPERFRGRNRASFQHALLNKVPLLTGKPIEVYGLKKDQQEFPAEVSVTAYMINDKTYFTSTIHDLTERKKLEEKILQSEKMEAIGTLAGGVAHDLNNILSAMVGYPDLLLLNIPQDNPLRKPLLSIKSSGEKAAAIVNDLLTLARRGVNVTEVVNLNAIITDYISSQHHEKLQSFHPRVEFDINLDPDIINMVGSPVHLSKTVMNLISNAAEAMPEGGNIIISTRNMYLDSPVNGYDTIKEGDYVVLSVTDTGTGISRENLSRIFEPFYTKKTMGRSGTGLGLAVVWGTIQDHNGYIEVDSTPGKGTSFSIYLPATRNKIAAKTATLPIEKYLGQGEYILVVDDAEPQREIASNILEKLNYQVATVSSGEAAVEYLKSNSCDLLVLDMLMDPGIDGLETYRRILSIAPHQKAIIASGFSESEQVKETQRLGAGAYIKKPYTLEEIGMAVKTELAK